MELTNLSVECCSLNASNPAGVQTSVCAAPEQSTSALPQPGRHISSQSGQWRAAAKSGLCFLMHLSAKKCVLPSVCLSSRGWEMCKCSTTLLPVIFFLFLVMLQAHYTHPHTHTHGHTCTHRSTKLLEACSAGDTSGRQMPTPNWASSQRDLHCFDRRAEDQGETVKS